MKSKNRGRPARVINCCPRLPGRYGGRKRGSIALVAMAHPLPTWPRAFRVNMSRCCICRRLRQKMPKRRYSFLHESEQDSWRQKGRSVALLRWMGWICWKATGISLTIPVNNMICASYLADILAKWMRNTMICISRMWRLMWLMSDMDLRIREATAQLEGTKISCKDGSICILHANMDWSWMGKKKPLFCTRISILGRGGRGSSLSSVDGAQSGSAGSSDHLIFALKS